MIIDLGDAYSIRYEARDPITRALTDTTMALTVTDPTGATSTPSITHTSTGLYDATFTASLAGQWYWQWAATGVITDNAYGTVEVSALAAPTVYATLTDLKLAVGEIVDSTRDSLLLLAIAAASRSIDQYCGRRFYADRVTSSRIFRTIGETVWDPDGEMILIDDLSAAPTLVEIGDGVAFSPVTDYFTEPVNALVLGQPIQFLRRRRWYWTYPYQVSRLRVTGLWGWPGVPDEVQQATILLASRLFNRRKSPEGITGNADWGLVRVTRADPDVASLIQPYQLMSVG